MIVTQSHSVIPSHSFDVLSSWHHRLITYARSAIVPTLAPGLALLVIMSLDMIASDAKDANMITSSVHHVGLLPMQPLRMLSSASELT